MNAGLAEIGIGIMVMAVLGFFLVFWNWGPNPMNQAVMFQHPTGVVPAQLRDTRRRTIFRRWMWIFILSGLFLAGLWGVNRELTEGLLWSLAELIRIILVLVATVCQTLADAIGGVA